MRMWDRERILHAASMTIAPDDLPSGANPCSDDGILERDRVATHDPNRGDPVNILWILHRAVVSVDVKAGRSLNEAASHGTCIRATGFQLTQETLAERVHVFNVAEQIFHLFAL